MKRHKDLRRSVPIWLACGLAGWLAPLAVAAADCIADMKQPQRPTDPALCERLEKTVRNPSGLPLDQYETALGDYLRNYCHRRTDAGWTPDKRVRDTGPFVGTIDLTTGIVTPIVTGLMGPGGLMFVDTSKHGWPDWKRDDNACRDDRE